MRASSQVRSSFSGWRSSRSKVQASEEEVLRDDAVGLAEMARQAGVEVELHLYPGMPHVWQLHYPAFPEAVEAVTELGSFLTRVAQRS